MATLTQIDPRLEELVRLMVDEDEVVSTADLQNQLENVIMKAEDQGMQVDMIEVLKTYTPKSYKCRLYKRFLETL